MYPPFRKTTLNRSEHPILHTRIFQVQLTQQLLDIFSASMSVCRAGTFDNRNIMLMDKSDHIRFLHINERTDHRQIHPIQKSDRGKRMEAPFINQRQHQRLHDIVLVVCISNFVAACPTDRFI